MSDGPYKSLNMSPAWRRVAKVAANANHSVAEVAEAFRPALLEEMSAVRPQYLRSLRTALGDDEHGLLFPEVAQAEMRRLRASAATPVEALLVDNAGDLARDGRLGASAFHDAIRNTLEDRAVQRSRQIEEHYKREAPRSAEPLRSKLDASVSAIGADQMADAIVSGAGARTIAPKTDRSGLDEGVSL